MVVVIIQAVGLMLLLLVTLCRLCYVALELKAFGRFLVCNKTCDVLLDGTEDKVEWTLWKSKKLRIRFCLLCKWTAL